MNKKKLFAIITGCALLVYLMRPSQSERLTEEETRSTLQYIRETKSYDETSTPATQVSEKEYDSACNHQTQSIIRHSHSKPIDYDLWNRKNMTMDGEEGINPWDAEQTEYDLMYEDPDLYDFIAD